MTLVVDWMSWFLRIMWAVRVSVVYGFAGVLFFGSAVPAQNLFADLSSINSPSAEFLFWAGVFFFTFAFWAFPIHYGARHTLEDDAWILTHAVRDELSAKCVEQVVHPVRCRFRWLIVWTPRVLGILPFVAIAFGIHGALGAIKGADILAESALTRTQGYWLYVGDGVTGFAFVAFVIFRRPWLETFAISRDLFRHAAVVATAAIFAFCYVMPITASVLLPRALLVPPLFGSLVLLFSLLQRIGNRTGFPFLLALFVGLGVLTGLNASFNDLRVLPNPSGAMPSPDERLSVDAALLRWKQANGCESGGCPRPIVIAIDGGASRAAFTAATFVGAFMDRLAAADTTGVPGRRIFAISGVSGGAYGAAVIQAAIADAQISRGGAPPCRSAQTTWFGYGDWDTHERHFTWRQCLQALTSGDYLTATTIGLGFRDFFAPPWQDIPLLHLPAMKDRAGILEVAWERQYSATLTQGTPFFEGGAACDDKAGEGLCRRAAHPAAFLDEDPLRWMPMLLLNGTSVATGRRIISSDLLSRPRSKDATVALYPEALDLREAMAEPCPDTPKPTVLATANTVRHLDDAGAQGRNERTGHLGICGVAAPVLGPDVRLSTAGLTSARFPIVSPAGVFAMAGSRYGDQVVDGGYFENSGITTALDIVAAIKDADPILVSIANDPAIAPLTEAEIAACATALGSPLGCTGLPRRPTTTPLVVLADRSLTGRIFGFLWRPIETILSTREGHAAEALGRAEAAFPQPGGGFYRLKVDVAPDFTEPLAADSTCAAYANKKLVMAEVSMSWWLSASVQADLDAQRCSVGNSKVLADLVGATKLKARPVAPPAPVPPR